jgi:AraC-like DNA-binding protein
MQRFFALVDLLQASVELRGSALSACVVRELGHVEMPSQAHLTVMCVMVARMLARLSPILDPDVRSALLQRVLGSVNLTALRTSAQDWHAVVCEGAGDQRVAMALELARTHYREPRAVRLDQLAKAVNLSPTYLSRLIVMQTGIGLTEHIRRLRALEAVELLRDCTVTLRAVATRIGYTSESVLCRDFKRVMGISPRRYVGRSKSNSSL